MAGESYSSCKGRCELMAQITLPRWILTQKCMASGWRTAKKPVLPNAWPTWDRGIVVHDARKGYIPKEIDELFKGWEYRFWAADISVNTRSVIAECRCCGNIGGADISARHLHLNQGGCSRRLCAAFKLLLLDRVCVICNMRTDLQKWGVPLCSSACQECWCTSESQPKALQQALQLIGEI